MTSLPLLGSLVPPHHYSMAWPKGHQWLNFDGVFGYKPKPVALRQRREDELHLHQRKVLANTPARSTAERIIGKFRPICRPFWGESLRVKYIGTLPKVWVTVGHIGAHHQLDALGNAIATDLILFNRLARD